MYLIFYVTYVSVCILYYGCFTSFYVCISIAEFLYYIFRFCQFYLYRRVFMLLIPYQFYFVVFYVLCVIIYLSSSFYDFYRRVLIYVIELLSLSYFKLFKLKIRVFIFLNYLNSSSIFMLFFPFMSFIHCIVEFYFNNTFYLSSNNCYSCASFILG